MGRKMRRGKQQIMLRFLPGKVFDFERVATIAQVRSIRGNPRTDLNVSVVLAKISEEAMAWDAEYRPTLRDNVLGDPSNFVLLDPVEVQAVLFPTVFRCTSAGCGQVVEREATENLGTRCPRCNDQSLVQLRFVKVHRCGHIQALDPPSCSRCRTKRHMSLDMRASERITNFRWICRSSGCSFRQGLFSGNCPACQWPIAALRQMDIEPHRAGKTFYPHATVLLNLPSRELDAFLGVPDWQCIVGAKFLEMPDVVNRPLSDFRVITPGSSGSQISMGLSADELNALSEQVVLGTLTAEEFVTQTQQLLTQRQSEQRSASSAGVAQALIDQSGVERAVWVNSGQELLEAVMPLESNTPRHLRDL